MKNCTNKGSYYSEINRTFLVRIYEYIAAEICLSFKSKDMCQIARSICAFKMDEKWNYRTE